VTDVAAATGAVVVIGVVEIAVAEIAAEMTVTGVVVDGISPLSPISGCKVALRRVTATTAARFLVHCE
jgi:hypothetical protein